MRSAAAAAKHDDDGRLHYEAGTMQRTKSGFRID